MIGLIIIVFFFCDCFRCVVIIVEVHVPYWYGILVCNSTNRACVRDVHQCFKDLGRELGPGSE